MVTMIKIGIYNCYLLTRFILSKKEFSCVLSVPEKEKSGTKVSLFFRYPNILGTPLTILRDFKNL